MKKFFIIQIFYEDPYKDYFLYYDTIDECLEKYGTTLFSTTTPITLMASTTTTITTTSITTTTTSTTTTTTTTLASTEAVTFENREITSAEEISVTIASPTTTATMTSPPIKPENIQTKAPQTDNTDKKEKPIDRTTIVLLILSLPSFIVGMLISGCFIYLYIKRKMVKKQIKGMKNHLFNPKRRKTDKASPTAEDPPQIEEEFIPKVTPPSKVKINDEPTPKRSDLRRFMDGLKKKKTVVKKEPQNAIKTTNFVQFPMFEEFKDSPPSDTIMDSRKDSVGSRKY